MTWKQKTICRILLIIARFCAEDEATAAELKSLGNHISVSREKE